MRSCEVVLFLPLLVCASVFLACGWVTSGEFRQQGVVDVPSGPEPFPPIDGGAGVRDFVMTTDIPSETGGGVVVFARQREVVYIDATSLDVIRRRTYSANERALISLNGKYVAVVSEIENRRTNKIKRTVRVEDWKGEVLWEMPAGMYALYEPTPSGGFIAYTSGAYRLKTDIHPDEQRLVPPLRPHPLLVYDGAGSLILEGLDYEECRAGCKGVVSPDGRYLAVFFRWIPPENRSGGSSDSEDRACLILYDIVHGEELWRRYFEGNLVGRLVVSRDAWRILCFVGSLEVWPSANFEIALLDREGDLLLHKQMAPRDKRFVPRSPVLSPDGRYCAFSTHDLHVYVMNMEDGSELWDWTYVQGGIGLRCLGVSDDGWVLLWENRGDMGEGRIEPAITLLNNRGETVYTIDSDHLRNRGRTLGGALAADGQSFWLVQEDGLSRYGISSQPSEKGGDRK